MSQWYKQNMEIRHYMGDRHQRMTLPMLVNVLLEVSEQHSNALGRGDKYIRNKGLSWIILRYAFDIKRLPRVNETVEIGTAATGYNKLFTYRDFLVKDSAGNEPVKITTTFALLDYSSRKLSRITEELVRPYEAKSEKRIRRVSKPFEVNKENKSEKQYRVRYFDIDSNYHVNNSHYITWLLDSLDRVHLSEYEVTTGTITFDKEVSEGQLITSHFSIRMTDEMWTDHSITSHSVTHCQASFKWKKVREEG